MKLGKRINSFLDISSNNPDDARRRKLLNIILLGVFFISLLLQITTISLWFTTPRDEWISGAQNIFFATLGLLVASILIFILNHYVQGGLAAALFLVTVSIAITFVDSAQELTSGRSIFLFTIPIFIASMLLPSWTAFIAAGLSIVTLSYLITTTTGDFMSLMPTHFTLLFIAMLSWLSSRSAETALHDLRKLNKELDQRVATRTSELSASLERERIESGRSKAILDSIADGVIVFDMDGNAIVANPSSERLLEMTSQQLLDATINSLSHAPALDARNSGLLAGLLSSPGQQLTNYRIQWGKKTLSITASRVSDSNGRHIGTVAVFRDYTREAEVERMKSTFLAIVSHELRTPLNAILGYAEMLKEAVYGPVNDKQARASERIMTNSRRLLEIVSDLLDQAQMEAGKLTIHMRAFRPAELIENVHGVMDKIANDKGLALTSELDAGLPETINGDASRLQQVLVNLINNAIKFTDTGSVHMRLAKADKKHWAMEVLDTGIGIPEEELPTIFDAFRQVDSSATRKHGGFGLGLTIVKQLTELMGGELKVSSQPNVGSIFTVTLPLVQVRRKTK